MSNVDCSVLEDIEWEDNSNSSVSGDESNHNTSSGGINDCGILHMSPCEITVTVDGHEIEKPLEEQKKSKKRSYMNYSKVDREDAICLHRDCMLQLLSEAIATADACSDEELFASIMSLLPTRLTGSTSISSEHDERELLGCLVLWFRETFTCIDNSSVTREEGRDGSEPVQLLHILRNKAGSAHQLNQLFVTASRVLGFKARYVVTLDPPPPKPGAFIQIQNRARKRMGTIPDDNFVSEATIESIDADVSYEYSKEFLSTDRTIPLSWTEVLIKNSESLAANTIHDEFASSPFEKAIENNVSKVVIDISGDTTDEENSSKITSNPKKTCKKVPSSSLPSQGEDNNNSQSLDKKSTKKNHRWICIDVAFSGFIDKPNIISRLRPQRKQICCAIAVDDRGNSTDVTARYLMPLEKLLETRKNNYDFNWWVQYIRNMNVDNPMSIFDDDIATFENLADKTIPTSLSAFKFHPVYALEKFIKCDEGINPQKKIVAGVFKGLPIYNRTSVEKLLSKKEWKRRSRQVSPRELPIKTRTIVKENGENKIQIPLYGSWQTEIIQRGSVVDGILPINEYGNLEILEYNTNLLPFGATYIHEQFGEDAAVKLSLPYAPAVVGFESKKGYNGPGSTFPIIDGVVVLSEHADLVREVSISLLQEYLLNCGNKHENKCLSRWKTLVKGLLCREELRIKYGF